MKPYLISLFIDNELDLDEKIEFVEAVHADAAVKAETVQLLVQEKQLAADPVQTIPPVVPSGTAGRGHVKWLRTLAYGLGSAAVIALLWLALIPGGNQSMSQPVKWHRFVLYRPDVGRAEIAGSFTDWQPRQMMRLGDSGYWEAEMQLPEGEHRFVYILEGRRHITDPTVSTRERDDFGGENSILRVVL